MITGCVRASAVGEMLGCAASAPSASENALIWWTVRFLNRVDSMVDPSPSYPSLLLSEAPRLARAAQDAMLGTERIQGHHTSALRCPDGRQPGSQ